MELRTVVAGIALDAANDPLLESAVALARRAGADLFLVHAFPQDPSHRLRLDPLPSGMDGVEGYRSAVESRIDERVLALGATGRVHALARPGRPEDVLPAVAAEVHADLVLLAPTRRGALSGRILGTTAQHVVRHAPAPVLVLHPPLASAARVLLTTDLSAHSHPAHALGLTVAGALGGEGAELRTLHVTPPVYADEGAGGATDDLQRGAGDLADFLASAAGPATSPRVRVGEPAREIVREAAEWPADLLVLGTHARTGAARWLLGSVAETVLRTAPCSVLVIPPPAARGATEPARAPAAEAAPAP
jgi:nucleotide-binding universal stress UspA family protein